MPKSVEDVRLSIERVRFVKAFDWFSPSCCSSAGEGGLGGSDGAGVICHARCGRGRRMVFDSAMLGI